MADAAGIYLTLDSPEFISLLENNNYLIMTCNSFYESSRFNSDQVIKQTMQLIHTHALKVVARVDKIYKFFLMFNADGCDIQLLDLLNFIKINLECLAELLAAHISIINFIKSITIGGTPVFSNIVELMMLIHVDLAGVIASIRACQASVDNAIDMEAVPNSPIVSGIFPFFDTICCAGRPRKPPKMTQVEYELEDKDKLDEQVAQRCIKSKI